ncbi:MULTISPECIES: DUF3021 domain-containing protein [unclassified Lactobacillus]|uniref:DUF3021 domain-containing protein n=1 Tax=unclassified Lactobacillus TaxID=2620435 RepID=UPI000EFA7C14|nr:DUF3021 domain-containing protein [Lactobacillus sp. ESL0247]RMC29208.1 DUF3021 domain-containing protein [Lactobacillus sp. ESL0246]RMC32811.1 DUF3021 domain-containing protein [Lactobacillus sp. ESL0245]
MNLCKKIFKLALWSAPIGVNIGILSYLIFSPSFNPFSSLSNFEHFFQNSVSVNLVDLFIWALIGIIFGCSSLIYQVETWSITKQTLVHFCITYSSLSIMSIFANWYKLLDFTINFCIIYLIVWSVSIIRAKMTVRSLNRKLHQKNQN